MKKGAISVARRFNLRRIKCVGGPCKTLKLNDPLPAVVNMAPMGFYRLAEDKYQWVDR